MSTDGHYRLAFVCSHINEYQSQKHKAQELLKLGAFFSSPQGLFFNKSKREPVAFVFTGARTTYADVSKSLLNAHLELICLLKSKISDLASILDCLYQSMDFETDLFSELKAHSVLIQAHVTFCQEICGLKADAFIGYCPGENNSLIASGAWDDVDVFFDQIARSNFYTEHLGVSCSVLGDISLIPPDDFRKVIEQAYADGIRVFVEVGPRDLCTQWIKQTLGSTVQK